MNDTQPPVHHLNSELDELWQLVLRAEQLLADAIAEVAAARDLAAQVRRQYFDRLGVSGDARIIPAIP